MRVELEFGLKSADTSINTHLHCPLSPFVITPPSVYLCPNVLLPLFSTHSNFEYKQLVAGPYPFSAVNSSFSFPRHLFQ